MSAKSNRKVVRRMLDRKRSAAAKAETLRRREIRAQKTGRAR
jgi:hypothetical protein